MLFDLIDLLERHEAYVCVWRDGEVHIEPLAATFATGPESPHRASKELTAA